MMANIPPHEKEAFFSLLDEYFSSRPHRLPSASTAAPAAPIRSVSGLTDRATTAAGNAAGAAASTAVSNALRDQFSRTGISSKGPPPPAPSAASKPGGFGARALDRVPAGLVSQKTLGGLNLGSRTPSSSSVPAAPAPTAPLGRTMPPPTRTGASVPAAAPAAPALPAGVIGTATVLYDYGDGSDPDDLQVSEGEQIYLTEQISDDWWRGMSTDQGRQGIIPTSYVRQL